MTTVPVGEILATLGALLALIGFIMAGIASRRLTLARKRIESIETRLNYLQMLVLIPQRRMFDGATARSQPYRLLEDASPPLAPLPEMSKTLIEQPRPGASQDPARGKR